MKKLTGAICKTCNSQGLRNCAHPEECGNWEPIYEYLGTKKEEAKTVERKTAEDTLIDKIIDSTSLGDTNKDIVFRSLWMLFDPFPAKSIILRAMQGHLCINATKFCRHK